jgi:hypothetical protein
MALPPLSILLALCSPALGYVIIVPVDDGGDDGDGDGDDTTINVVAFVLTLVGLIGERLIILIYCLEILNIHVSSQFCRFYSSGLL